MTLLAPISWLAGALVAFTDLPWWLRAGLALPGLLLAPGFALAAARGSRREALQVLVDGAWLGVAVAVFEVALLRWTGAGLPGLVALSGAVTVAGTLLARGASPIRLPGRSLRVGLLTLLVAVGAVAWTSRADLARPLEGFWWHEHAELDWSGPATSAHDLGDRAWEDAETGALWLTSAGTSGRLEVQGRGDVLVLLRGRIGAKLEVPGQTATVAADVEVRPEEGAVPRYLDAGVTGLVIRGPGSVPVTLVPAAPGDVLDLYVLPGSEAVWSLHGSGMLRFFHYYQLLNIVENLRWADELLHDRALTVNQPPLWSNVLALALLVVPGLQGANVLFLGVVLLVGVTGLRLLEVVAPKAPAVAWALPGVYAAVHARLMIVPGSTCFPDSLYAAAMVGGVLALALAGDAGAHRVAGLGLAAGLLRYPGTVAVTLFGLAQGLVYGRTPWRALATLWAVVAALAAALGLAAVANGQLGHWLEILWFETGPEHFANNTEPLPLWQRPPTFFGLWALYTGGGLVIAGVAAVLLAWHRRGRAVVWLTACAVGYGTLLCPIDHFPSHYFLPGVALTGVAVAAACAELRHPVAREGLAAVALAGALAWLRLGHLHG